MQKRIYQFRQLSPRGVSWLGKLGLFAAVAAGIALVAAFAVLSVVLAVVLIPVAAAALLILRWRMGRAAREAANAQGGDASQRRPAVIETEYVVIDRDRQ